MNDSLPPTDAVNMLFDATKTLIPVVTGFIVFFAATLPKLWKPARPLLSSERRVLIAGLILGIFSLGLWTGVMPYCIIAIEKRDWDMFHYGQMCARAAHILFFLSVCCALYIYYQNFNRGYAKPSNAD